jgi:outer membrane protein assembly factor BamA
MRFIIFIILVSTILLTFGSCQNTKHYLRAHSDTQHKRKKVYDEHLLVKNSILLNRPKLFTKKKSNIVCEDSITIPTQTYQLDSDIESYLYYDMYGMLRQKPNRTIFFAKPFLYIHTLADTLKVKYSYDRNFRWEKAEGEWIQGGIKPDTLLRKFKNAVYKKPGKFRMFLLNKIGEKPAVFDSLKARLTAKSMQNHLIQKGFLEAKVGYSVNYKGHKAFVSYHYYTGKPIIIDTVVYQSPDSSILALMENNKTGAELKKGNPMDKAAFQLEKTRLTSIIRNNGYYNFNWNYINFLADTVNASESPAVKKSTLFGKTNSKKMGEQGEKRVQIYVNVNVPADTIKKHTQYNIKDVYIVLDEPKVELHKIRRTYLMDTTFVVLRPPREKLEISHMYRANPQISDSLAYLYVFSDESRDVVSELFQKSGKSVLIVSNSKYPYWLKIKKYKRNGKEYPLGTMEVIDKNKINLIFPAPEAKTFHRNAIHTKFIVELNAKMYSFELSPYKRRFVKDAHKNLSEIEHEDIPVHTILRKPAISSETDSIAKAKDIIKLKKENFIIKNEIISQFVDINSGALYTYNAGSETVRRLSELEIFRFPRVEYVPSKAGAKNELDAYVYMQKAKKKLFGIESDFNTMTNATNLGWALNLNFKNRNVFKGAEIFLFNVEGGVNFDPTRSRANVNNVKGIISWIDLLDLNSSLNLFFPKIIGFRNWTLSVEKPKTRTSISYHYLQQSIDFRVSSFDAIFGYDWQIKNATHVFNFNPFMLNFTLEPILDPNFDLRLRENNFALWASLKEQYFLPGLNFTYTYTPKLKGRHRLQLKGFFETTGNTALLYSLITQKKLELFQTSVSQYYKGEVDIRHTYKISKKQTLASRFMAGAAVPVFGSARVPYSRQFFLGGPSSMRGWAMRQLGPGRIRSEDDAQFQLGDIRLEMNLEYRYRINTWIGTAFFVDAGNIWYAKKYSTNSNQIPYSVVEDGVFNANFMNELAMDIGTGLRFDITFFVFRVDLAIPVRNPAGFSIKDSNGFVSYTNDKGFPNFWKFDWRNPNVVLAVGYPF